MFTNNSEDVAQNKLLILFIIKNSPKSLTNEGLTEFILNKNFINYFLFQQYLGELINGEFIEIVQDNNYVYKLLDKGEKTLELFENKISPGIREDILKEFKLQQIILKRQTQIVADLFIKENNQYNVNLKLVENDETLFSLYLEVPTREQAESICKLWKDNPNIIYQDIINIFIDRI